MTAFELAQILAICAASVTAIGVITRVRVLRYIGRMLFAEPVRMILRTEVNAILDQRPMMNGTGERILCELPQAVEALRGEVMALSRKVDGMAESEQQSRQQASDDAKQFRDETEGRYQDAMERHNHD